MPDPFSANRHIGLNYQSPIPDHAEALESIHARRDEREQVENDTLAATRELAHSIKKMDARERAGQRLEARRAKANNRFNWATLVIITLTLIAAILVPIIVS